MPEAAGPEYPSPPRRPNVPDSKRPRWGHLKLPRRPWSTRPITLAIGWIMSCALVTAVTLTAVNRVGHEVAGQTPRVVSPAVVSAQVSQNSAAAAAASLTARSSTPAAPSTTEPATSPAAAKPTPSRQQTKTASPTKPATKSTPPVASAPASSPQPSSSGPSAPASSSAPQSPPSSDSATPDPSPSPSGHKNVIQLTEGLIIITCSGDSIAAASASHADGYAMTVKSTTDPAVDIEFSKGDTTTEYVYKCRGGDAIGGVVERP